MKKYQRFLALALAGVMSLGLAACGDEKVTDDEIVTLTWCLPTNDYSDEATIEAAINEITVPKIGAKVDIMPFDYGTYPEKMRMKQAAGEDNFDIMFVGYLNSYLQAVNNGTLEPLNDLIDEYAPELKDAIPEYAWIDAYVGEEKEVYAVPNLQIMANQYAFGIQKKLAEKYGWTKTEIETPEELEPFLEQVAANEPDIYPYRPNYGLNMWMTGYDTSYGFMTAYKLDGTGDLVWQWDTPEYNRGMQTLRKWFEKGWIRKDVASVGDDNTDFNALRYAVYNSTWKPGQEAQYPDYMYVKIGPGTIKSGASTATMNGINYLSKNKEKAIKLIALMSTDVELLNIMSIGLEGKHYTLTEDGKYEVIENCGYAVAAWSIGNQFLSIPNVNQDADVWEQTMELNETAISSPLRGHLLIVTDKNVSAISGGISAVTGEYSGPMNNGSRAPEEYWDEMMKRLDDCDAQDYLEYAQNYLAKQLSGEIATGDELNAEEAAE